MPDGPPSRQSSSSKPNHRSISFGNFRSTAPAGPSAPRRSLPLPSNRDSPIVISDSDDDDPKIASTSHASTSTSRTKVPTKKAPVVVREASASSDELPTMDSIFRDVLQGPASNSKPHVAAPRPTLPQQAVQPRPLFNSLSNASSSGQPSRPSSSALISAQARPIKRAKAVKPPSAPGPPAVYRNGEGSRSNPHILVESSPEPPPSRSKKSKISTAAQPKVQRTSGSTGFYRSRPSEYADRHHVAGSSTQVARSATSMPSSRPSPHAPQRQAPAAKAPGPSRLPTIEDVLVSRAQMSSARSDAQLPGASVTQRHPAQTSHSPHAPAPARDPTPIRHTIQSAPSRSQTSSSRPIAQLPRVSTTSTPSPHVSHRPVLVATATKPSPHPLSNDLAASRSQASSSRPDASTLATSRSLKSTSIGPRPIPQVPIDPPKSSQAKMPPPIPSGQAQYRPRQPNVEPSPTASNASLPSLHSRYSSPDKDSNSQKTGFGSHAKKAKGPVIGRALSKQGLIRTGSQSPAPGLAGSGHRIFARTPSAGQLQDGPSTPSKLHAFARPPTASPNKPSHLSHSTTMRVDSAAKARAEAEAASLNRVYPSRGSSTLPAVKARAPSGPKRLALEDRAFRDKRTGSNNSNASTQSDPSRPRRARPAAGTYVIPTMEAQEWPSSQGTMGPKGRRAPSGRKSGLAQSSTAPRQPTSGTLYAITGSGNNLPRRGPIELGSPETPSPRFSSPLSDAPASPSRPPAEGGEEVDLDALWDDYEFTAPELNGDLNMDADATVNLGGHEPLSPSKRAGANEHVSAPDANVGSPTVTPSKRGASQAEHASPDSATKRQKLQQQADRAAELIALKDAARQAALEEGRRQFEEARRQAEADTESDEEEDDDLEDLDAAMAAIAAEPEEVKPVITQQLPTQVDRYAKQKKTNWQDGMGDPEELLREFAALRDEIKDERTSMDGSAEPEEGVEGDQSRARLHAAIEQLPEELMMDKEALRGMADVTFEAEKPWTGFWTCFDRREVGEREVVPAPSLKSEEAKSWTAGRLGRAIARCDFGCIAMCLGGREAAVTLRDEIDVGELARWLLDMTMTRPANEANLASMALCRVLKLDLGDMPLFDADKSLTATMIAMLFRLGMAKNVTDVVELPSLPLLTIERDAAIDLICAIAGAASAHPRTTSLHGLDIAWVLLVLATDDLTSEPLLRAIDHVLPSLWTLATRKESPIEVAAQLLAASQQLELPITARARMVLRVGCRTEVQHDLARWLAIGMLLPQSLDAALIESKPKRPDIDLIIAGADLIYVELEKSDQDHHTIRYQLVLLTEACSDVHALIESCLGSKREWEHFIKLLGRAARKIVTRGFSQDREYENKTKLSQLQGNLVKIEEIVRKRRRAAKVGRMRGLEVGPQVVDWSGKGQGQLRLSFGGGAKRGKKEEGREGEAGEDEGSEGEGEGEGREEEQQGADEQDGREQQDGKEQEEDEEGKGGGEGQKEGEGRKKIEGEGTGNDGVSSMA